MRKSSMQRTLVGGVAFAAVVLAAAARGDDPPPSQTSAVVQSAYSTKLICKREQVTGSMIPKRVCKTQEQIDKEHEAQKQYADEMRRSSTTAAPTIPGPLPSDHAGG